MGRAKQAYGFKYDDLDRLTESKYFDITDSYNSSNHQWSSSYSTDYKFNESSTYDVRGNILSLLRNGLNDGNWTGNEYVAATYGLIDNLTYNYNGQNQVTKVVDASLANKGFIYKNASVGTSYTYDSNGNLTSDANKGIISIEYNYLNLPMKIVFNRTFMTSYSNGSIEFIYDATGVKLRKTVKDVNGNVLDTRDYVNGVEYNNGTLSRIAHSEGSVERNEFGAYEHQYVLRDHLGNTRVTFRDGINKGDAYFDWYTYTYVDPNAGNTTGLNDGVITSADIKQLNSYYPFGLNMESNFNGAAGKNKYAYNGKEWNDDFSLGWNDYGARFYDPAIGRWSVIDMKSEKYNNITPYAYVANMPIKAIDPDGKDIIVVSKEDQGKVLAMINSKSAGTFAFNDAGKLYQTSAVNDKKEGSTYYQEKLNAAIKSDLTVEIQIKKTYKEPKLCSPDGKTLIKDGTDKEVDVHAAGEGQTFGWDKTNQLVTLTGDENTTLKDTEGNQLVDKAADVLVHELVGHAIPAIIGKDTGNAIKNENKVRSQNGQKERKANEKHVE